LTANSSNLPGDEPFYASQPLERDLLYQGEILIDTPIFQMPLPSRWLVIRTQSGRRIDEALNYGSAAAENRVRVLDSNKFPLEWQQSKLGDFVVGVLDKTPALVLSQNCDIANRDFVQVAPIIPIESSTEEHIVLLKTHSILDSFYLKPHPPEWETEAYADFERIQSVHKTYLKGIPAENHFRLSDTKIILLQRHLTRFFGRPNSYDANTDLVPRNGRYLCIRCFYKDGVATGVTLAENDHFPVCEMCGGVGWVAQFESNPAI
jgi:hypothetical protein